MKHTIIESLLGAIVLAIAAWFAFYGYQNADVKSDNDYTLTADFSTVGALKAGDPVRISGVKVGSVKEIVLNQQNYIARVTITMDVKFPLPSDTSAAIMSDSLMGGIYLSVTPGGDDETLPSGSRITYTQSPQNLGELLGKFIFSSKGESKDD